MRNQIAYSALFYTKSRIDMDFESEKRGNPPI